MWGGGGGGGQRVRHCVCAAPPPPAPPTPPPPPPILGVVRGHALLGAQEVNWQKQSLGSRGKYSAQKNWAAFSPYIFISLQVPGRRIPDPGPEFPVQSVYLVGALPISHLSSHDVAHLLSQFVHLPLQVLQLTLNFGKVVLGLDLKDGWNAEPYPRTRKKWCAGKPEDIGCEQGEVGGAG